MIVHSNGRESVGGVGGVGSVGRNYKTYVSSPLLCRTTRTGKLINLAVFTLEVDLTDGGHSVLINCERKMRQSIEMAQKIQNI